jgi:hypothetical protein
MHSRPPSSSRRISGGVSRRGCFRLGFLLTTGLDTRDASGCQVLIFRPCVTVGAGALFRFMAARLLLSDHSSGGNVSGRVGRRGRSCVAVSSAHLKKDRRGSVAGCSAGNQSAGVIADRWPDRWPVEVQADRLTWPRPPLGGRIAARLGGRSACRSVISVKATSAGQRRGGQLAVVAGRWPVTSDNRSNVKSLVGVNRWRSALGAEARRPDIRSAAIVAAIGRASVTLGGEGVAAARRARAPIRSMRLKFYRQMGQ